MAFFLRNFKLSFDRLTVSETKYSWWKRLMRLLFTYLMGMTILYLGHWYGRPRCPVGLSVCGSGTSCERCTWEVSIRVYYPVRQRHWGQGPEISA